MRNSFAIRTICLHLLGRVRRDGGRGDLLLGLAPERRVRVAIERDVLVAREHPSAPDDREALERALEIRFADARRNGHVAVPC